MGSSVSGPLISVLIPVWNREDTIGRAFESVLASSYQNMEIVISDNASEDRTPAIIEQYAKQNSVIKFLRNQENIGAVRNWLKCFEASAGDFIKFVWSDDAVEADTCEKLLQPMLESRDLAFTFCPARHIRVDPQDGAKERLLYVTRGLRQVDVEGYVTGFGLRIPHLRASPGAALIRRWAAAHAIQRLRTFDARCTGKAIGADLIITYEALVPGQKGQFVEDTRVVYYNHHASLTRLAGRQLLSCCYDSAVLHQLQGQNC